MAEFYVTQERAMAPGVAGEWPDVISKPDNPNGRLVKVDGVQDMIDGLAKMNRSDYESEEWLAGIAQAEEGLRKVTS